jgi:uncharacterized protein YyaL (SSP411 family)
VLQSAKQVTGYLQAQARSVPPQGVPGPEVIIGAARRLGARFDPENGGFVGAPKFPRVSEYELLLRYARRSHDDNAVAIVKQSLDGMIKGGIYDQIGGGFHRYSTDERWLVPHFEKMLYDQAQLVELLLEAHQVTRNPVFARIAKETLDYVLREMVSQDGAFYSGTDADSEGAEGRFFVWTIDQVKAALPEKTADAAIAWFGVTKEGNFEGRTILHLGKPLDDVAGELGTSPEALASEIESARTTLRETREKRVHPLLDDEILTEWNGDMISALARAAFVLKEPKYAEAASRAAAFVLSKMKQDGRLLRSFRDNRAKHTAVLGDYAYFIQGLLDLYEGSGEPHWLEEAVALEKDVEKHYLDAANGGFFATPDDGEALLVREKPAYDGAQPSGTSIEALNLLRLSELTGDAHARALAEKTLGALGSVLERNALEVPKLATALDFLLDKPREVVLVRAAGDRGDALMDVIQRTFLPNRVLVLVDDGEPVVKLTRLVPIVENKRAVGGKTTAYVCTERVCQAPTSSPEVLTKQLAAVEELPLERKIVLPH